jgi:LysR family transcriptional regulator, regulator of abg operon
MKLHALQALVTAVDTGSLRSAARNLGVSQPALSKLIRELEHSLSATLLLRSSQGVKLTEQGEVLYTHGRKVLHELASATDKIQQLGGQFQGVIKVAAVPVAMLLLVPETLRTFNREFPDIRLRIHEELFVHQLQRLRTGEVDLVVGGIPAGLPAGEFVAEPLLHTVMVPVVRLGHPLARAGSLAQLAKQRWVYTSMNTDTGYASLLFEQHGLAAPPVGAVVNSTLGLLTLLAASDFVGLLPRQIAQHPLARQHVVAVPIQEPGLQLNVGAIVRRDTALATSVRQLINHLHRAAHPLQSA